MMTEKGVKSSAAVLCLLTIMQWSTGLAQDPITEGSSLGQFQNNPDNNSTVDLAEEWGTLTIPDVKPESFDYSVDESKSENETLIEVYSLICWESPFCNPAFSGNNDPEFCGDCKPCRCDEQCRYFGDCCADLAGTVADLSIPWTCVRRTDKTEFAFMVASCPRGPNTPEFGHIAEKCERPDETNLDQVSAVTDLTTNVTYRNRFCAKCHGVGDIAQWRLDVKCAPGAIRTTGFSREDLVRAVLTSSLCKINTFPPPNAYVRTCYGSYVDSCDPALNTYYSDATEKLCQTSLAPPVEDYGIMYRNIFCALCNSVEIKSCSRDKIFAFDQPGLNVLLDLNINPFVLQEFEEEETTSEEGVCMRNEAFDPIMNICRAIQCPPRRYFMAGDCQPAIVTAAAMGYELSFLVVFSHLVKTSDIPGLVTGYLHQIKESLSRFGPFDLWYAEYNDILQNDTYGWTGEVRGLGFVMTLGVVSPTKESLSTLEDSFRDLNDQIYMLPLGEHNISLHAKTIVCNEALLNQTPGVVVGKTKNYIGDKPCEGFFCIHYEFVSIFDTPGCPYVVLNLTEAEHSYNLTNGELIIKNQTLQLNRSSYIYCAGVLKLCTDSLIVIQKQLQSAPNLQKVDTAMGIVSVVCISFSLLSLLLTFLLFCFIPKLRTLPGKNTMALIFHLFCAELLFQVGIGATENEDVCIAMGMLIHYFWLTAFGWMGVSAYHMYTAFSSLSLARDAGSHIKPLAKYTVICHLLAIVFVSGCVGYNLGKSGGKIPGYGQRICFLNEALDIGVFFAAPLGIILVFNAVCFVKTIMIIHSVPDMSSAKNQTNQTHLSAYIRLSVLLGFTWVFGFVASALQSDVLWYIFVILNGLQGVFIAIAFCCNRRVYDMLKTRLDIGQPSVTSVTNTTRLSKSSTDNVTTNF